MHSARGAKAPSSPKEGLKTNFLPELQEMARWYYQSDTMLELHLEQFDDKCYVVTTLERIGDATKVSSFTIGLTIIEEIKRSYEFYHRVRKKPVKSTKNID